MDAGLGIWVEGDGGMHGEGRGMPGGSEQGDVDGEVR